MKKLIRLTEGDLHRIVENSIKRTLNELDWKTYANAATKYRDIAQNAYEKERKRREELNIPVWDDDNDYFEKHLSPREKRAIQYDNDRDNDDLTAAANKAFDRDYGFRDADRKTKLDMGSSHFDEFDYHYPIRMINHYPNKHSLAGESTRSLSYQPKINGEFQYNKYAGKELGSRDGFTPEELSAFDRAKDEVNKWANGKYKYIKGKGYTS